MSEKDPSTVQAMFARIADRYDIANSVLSFGLHHSWKRALVRDIPQSAQRVVDLATGTGDLLPEILKKHESACGIDFSSEMLTIARRKYAEKFGARLSLTIGDALHLPLTDCSVDAITISFGVRNFADTSAGLRECYRVLKPQGTIHILEFGTPWLPVLSTLYRLYGRYLLPLLGGWITGDREAYRYLPSTAAIFPCRDEFAAIMRSQNFKDCRWSSILGGIAYTYTAQKPA